MARINVTKLKAAVQAGVRAHRAFQDGDELIASLEGLQQHANELAVNVKNSQADLAAVNAELDQARDELRGTQDARGACQAEADQRAAKAREDAAAQIATLNAEIKARTAELADLDARISQSREVIAKLVGATG